VAGRPRGSAQHDCNAPRPQRGKHCCGSWAGKVGQVYRGTPKSIFWGPSPNAARVASARSFCSPCRSGLVAASRRTDEDTLRLERHRPLGPKAVVAYPLSRARSLTRSMKPGEIRPRCRSFCISASSSTSAANFCRTRSKSSNSPSKSARNWNAVNASEHSRASAAQLSP
jgi:hypothetical protein